MEGPIPSLSAAYEAVPDSVSRARAAVAQLAAEGGATARQVDAVKLAVSEAVTNAVMHAYRPPRPPGEVQVTAAIAGGELWILIADDGCGMLPRADRPGLGQGLGLISQVSDDMAVVSRSSGGTEVRVRFDLSRSTTGGAGVGDDGTGHRLTRLAT